MDVAHRATFSGHRAGGKSGCAPWVPESRQATLAHSGKSGRALGNGSRQATLTHSAAEQDVVVQDRSRLGSGA